MRSIDFPVGFARVSSLALIIGTVVAPAAVAEGCNSASTDYEDACNFPLAEPEIDLSVPDTPRAAPKSSAVIITQPAASQPDGAVPVPFVISPSDTGVSAKTSLGTFRDYNNQMKTRQYEGAKALAPAALSTPRPTLQKPTAIDIWTNVDAQGFSGAQTNGEATGSPAAYTINNAATAKTTRASAGADYALGRNTLVGIAAERAQTSDEITAAREDEKFAAFAAFKATPGLTINAKTQWEKGVTGFGLSQAANEKSSLTLQPRLSQPFALEGGKSLEPYLTVKQQYTVDAATSSDPNSSSAGAGLTLTQPNSYSLSVSTDVEGLGKTEPATVKGQLQLKLPLP